MRILLVDDHPIFRHGLTMLLSGLRPELQIDQCAHPEHLPGLLLQRGGEEFALALLDLHMPGFEDLQALTNFRELAPGVPVVVLSGDEDPLTVQACIDHGAWGYVPKSADPEVLVSAMERILGGGVWLPSSSLRIVDQATTPVQASTQGWTQMRLPITLRQRDVLQRVVQGKTNKVIGRELGISDGTVKTHLAHVMAMLGVNTRTQIVYELARQGIRVDQIALGP
jgi:DNA-binding NarL/FixJ family response regulator